MLLLTFGFYPEMSSGGVKSWIAKVLLSLLKIKTFPHFPLSSSLYALRVHFLINENIQISSQLTADDIKLNYTFHLHTRWTHKTHTNYMYIHAGGKRCMTEIEVSQESSKVLMQRYICELLSVCGVNEVGVVFPSSHLQSLWQWLKKKTSTVV